MDIIIRVVKGYGNLPIIIEDGKETYRGEFQTTPEEALVKCVKQTTPNRAESSKT